MSLIKKLIAGSALALATGCPAPDELFGDTVFRSQDLDGAGVELYRFKKETVCTGSGCARTCITGPTYKMVVSEEKSGCLYILKATPEGKVFDSEKRCDKTTPDKIKNSQEVFDSYLALIKEPLKK